MAAKQLPALDQPVALFADRQTRRAALIQIRAGNGGSHRLHRLVVQLHAALLDQPPRLAFRSRHAQRYHRVHDRHLHP